MQSILGILSDYPDQVNAGVAVLALVVSFLSIVIAALSMYWQRQHNFHSLTPIASVPQSNYEDEIEVAVENDGVGPMIIEHLTVTDEIDTKDDLRDLLPALPAGMLWDDFSGNCDEQCIRPGENISLIKLCGALSDRKFTEARDRCRQALSKLTLSLTYKDIYGRLMEPEQYDFAWFKEDVEVVKPPKKRRGRRPKKRRTR